MNYPPAHTLPVIATFGLSFGVSTCARLRSPWLLDLNSSWLTDPESHQQEQIRSFLLGIPFHEGYFPIHGSSWRVLGTFIRAANAGGAVGAFVFIPTSIPAPVIPHQAPAAFPGISPQLGRAGNPARAANLLLGFVDPLLPLSCCSQAPGDTEE